MRIMISEVEYLDVKVDGGITIIEQVSDTGGRQEIAVPTESIQEIADFVKGKKDNSYQNDDRNKKGIGELILDRLNQLNQQEAQPKVTTQQVDGFLSFYNQHVLPLNQEQSEVIYSSLLNNRVTIVSELAGTGVTQTVKAIIQCLGILNNKVKIDVLTATGKSKHFLTKRLNIPVNTFMESDLEGDLLILFDSQMMKNNRFNEILQNVGHQHVLIIGDAQQITPKECLNFRGLTKSTLPVIALTEQFRH